MSTADIAPCRVSIEERNYDIAQRGGDEQAARLDEISRDLAAELITDADRLKALVYDYEADIFGHLARALRNLDSACGGSALARDAILNAMTYLQRDLFLIARKEVADMAAQRVRG